MAIGGKKSLSAFYSDGCSTLNGLWFYTSWMWDANYIDIRAPATKLAVELVSYGECFKDIFNKGMAVV